MAAEDGVLITGLDGFEALAREWDALAVESGAPVFSRPGWIRAWWSAFGEGELRLYSLRRDGRLAAVLPLARRRRALRSCANVHTPVFEPVAAGPADLERLLAAAVGDSPRGLTLSCVRDGGPLAAAAERVGRGGWRPAETSSLPSSRVAAEGSWEDFEAGLKRKRRSDIRRSRKLLAKLGEVRTGPPDPALPPEPLIAESLRLEGSEWKRSHGTAISQSERVESFYRAAAAWAAAEGVLRLTFVWVDGRPVSTTLGVDDGSSRFSLKTGFDREFFRASPGVLQLIEDIREAREAGVPLELGTGDEALKLEFRTDAWQLREIVLFPRTAGGAVARGIVLGRAAARRRARESEALRGLRNRSRTVLTRLRERRSGP